MIEMNLGLGVYDIQNPDFVQAEFNQSSCPPIVMMNSDNEEAEPKKEEESSESDESSEDAGMDNAAL
jgi:hypothetical protein